MYCRPFPTNKDTKKHKSDAARMNNAKNRTKGTAKPLHHMNVPQDQGAPNNENNNNNNNNNAAGGGAAPHGQPRDSQSGNSSGDDDGDDEDGDGDHDSGAADTETSQQEVGAAADTAPRATRFPVEPPHDFSHVAETRVPHSETPMSLPAPREGTGTPIVPSITDTNSVSASAQRQHHQQHVQPQRQSPSSSPQQQQPQQQQHTQTHSRSASVGSMGSSSFRLANLSFGSSATSVRTAPDEVQEQLISQAFPVSFLDNNRVRHDTLRLCISDLSLVCVERYVCGHSDDVYSKNRSLWKHVPFGQARIAITTTVLNDPETPLAAEVKLLPSPSPLSAGIDHSDPPPPPPALSWVASLAGLRKFGELPGVSHYRAGRAPPVTAVATEAVDGASCQLTAFTTADGRRFWVIGGRTRHLVVRIHIPDEDVFACRRGDADGSEENVSERTQFAECVAVAWRALLDRVFDSASAVCAFHDTVATRKWTLCFDAVVCGWERLVGTAALRAPFESASVTIPPVSSHGSDVGRSPTSTDSPASPTGSSHSREGAPSAGRCRARPAHSQPLPQQDPGVCIETELWFYAVTTAGHPAETGLCLPLDESFAFFEQYRLPCVPRGPRLKIESPEFNAQLRRVLGKTGSAGAVVYEESEDGAVVSMWKCRSQPYMLERATQEYILNNLCTGDELTAKIARKLGNLSRENRACTRDWEASRVPFLVSFAGWLQETVKLTASCDAAARKALRSRWVTLQAMHRVACHNRNPDGGEAVAEEEETEKETEEETEEEEEEDEEGEDLSGSTNSTNTAVAGSPTERDSAARIEESNVAEHAAAIPDPSEVKPETIMLVGPQGCGKSTLARALIGLLEQAGVAPLWANQDECGSRGSFLSALRNANRRASPFTHVVVDKMNLDGKARDADYRSLDLDTVLVVAWEHPGGAQALASACTERILSRGSRHRTFRLSPVGGADGVSAAVHRIEEERLRGIVAGSVRSYHPPSAADSGTVPVLTLSVLDSKQTCLERAWQALCDCGRRALPLTSALDVQAALRLSAAYEPLLERFPHRISRVALEAAAPDALLSAVSPELLSSHGKMILSDIHVMLYNFLERPSVSTFVRAAALVGRQVPMVVRAVVSDHKATVLHLVPKDAADETFNFLPAPPKHFIAAMSRKSRVTEQQCANLLERALSGDDPFCTLIPYEDGTFAAPFLLRFLYT